MATEVRISVRNDSGFGGVALTPFFAGFHDGSFDIYDLGGKASVGLERLAEDGNNSVIAEELLAADADGQSVNVAAERGPIAARELATTTLQVDGASNGFLGVASMLLPSNDAFVGTANALQLFAPDGTFLGAQAIEFTGASVRDAGTEVNTERDAAFINQTAPNTGEDEGGVVTVHPGFNGSAGNPDGDQIILGGTNAFGDFIDPTTADFTLPGNDVATVHINVVERTEGSHRSDFVVGSAADDIVNGNGGRDVIFGGDGWDELSGGRGRDFLFGGAGDDVLDGGHGRDFLFGGTGSDDLIGGRGRDVLKGGDGDDNLSGGQGRDVLKGGTGDDVLAGGTGRDKLSGGAGDDVFLFAEGDGRDVIADLDRSGDDRIALNVDGIDSFDDILHAARDTYLGVRLN
ncbi:MAG: spondin domain-containing protein, partial [Pseudomonadota bacterium]